MRRYHIHVRFVQWPFGQYFYVHITMCPGGGHHFVQPLRDWRILRPGLLYFILSVNLKAGKIVSRGIWTQVLFDGRQAHWPLSHAWLVVQDKSMDKCARMDQCARMRPSQPNLTPHMDNTPAWISVHACMAQWQLVHPIVTISPPNCDSCHGVETARGRTDVDITVYLRTPEDPWTHFVQWCTYKTRITSLNSQFIHHITSRKIPL